MRSGFPALLEKLAPALYKSLETWVMVAGIMQKRCQTGHEVCVKLNKMLSDSWGSQLSSRKFT
eukprot:1474650-Amphidinium_carterae.1